MTNNRTSKAVLKWEQRLRAEGLAPLDQQTVWRGGSVRQDRYEQRTSGRLCVVVRTEIITPLLPYLPEPERLRAALEQWITGNASGFTRVGQALLGYTGNQSSPRRRARVLVRICDGLCDGLTVNQASSRAGGPHLADVAYRYLRPLYAALAEVSALVDDDTTGDDEPRSD